MNSIVRVGDGDGLHGEQWNHLEWDIFRYFYFFTKYIALLSLIVNKNEVFIYNMKNISLSFCSILYDILNLYTCKKTERKMNFEIVQLPN
jgi:hypothetical protein